MSPRTPDLGIRIYKAGHTTALLASRTWEESPNRTMSWLNQRSRWIKGYMQTWLVHMRHPLRLLRELKLKGYGLSGYGLRYFFLPLLNPLLWLISSGGSSPRRAGISAIFPGFIYYTALFLLIVGNFFFVYTAAPGACTGGG